jgi:glucose/arabinose dehydrogenase
MVFLGSNDILVLEREKGTVSRIVNGIKQNPPLLDTNVAVNDERGMLGIAVNRIDNESSYVFLYFTESTNDGDDKSQGKAPLGNHLYRYELRNDTLANPKLLLALPASPGDHHNGGKLLIGPDENLYLSIGDVEGHETQAQNFKNGPEPDGTSGILRLTQGGSAVQGIIGNKFPLNLYYAYGIRNTFGMDFDPVTKNLWDTENGPGFGDEVNLVEPGFNSGWATIQGIWKYQSYFGGEISKTPPYNLADFGGVGKYRSPEFVWNGTIGITSLKFLSSNKLGKQYQNDMFISDINNGNIYHFRLNDTRTGIVLNGSLSDKVADSVTETKNAVFATGFAGISDLEVGPDGYLYILTYHKSRGSIYRIVPVSMIDAEN